MVIKDDNATVVNAEEQLRAVQKLIEQEKEESKFSWGKGFVLGLLGKVGGTAVALHVREAEQAKLQTELMSKKAIGGLGGTAEANKDAINRAVKKASEGVSGLKGQMLRNKGWTAFGGGVVGGAVALGTEVVMHQMNKPKHEATLEALSKQEKIWQNRVDAERCAASKGTVRE